VATGEILPENERSLQQVSGNNIKRSVLCAFIAYFIVNCKINFKNGLFKISLVMTRLQFFSLTTEKISLATVLAIAHSHSLISELLFSG